MENLIQQTTEGKVEKIAQKTGRSTSLIRRHSNPNDECNMPVIMLPAVMEAAGDYRILRFLAHTSGHALLKLPKRLPKVGPRTVMELQGSLMGVMKTLMDYNGGGAGRDEADAAIMTGIEALLLVRRQIQTGGELPLEMPQLQLPLTER